MSVYSILENKIVGLFVFKNIHTLTNGKLYSASGSHVNFRVHAKISAMSWTRNNVQQYILYMVILSVQDVIMQIV